MDLIQFMMNRIFLVLIAILPGVESKFPNISSSAGFIFVCVFIAVVGFVLIFFTIVTCCQHHQNWRRRSSSTSTNNTATLPPALGQTISTISADLPPTYESLFPHFNSTNITANKSDKIVNA